MFNGRAQRAIQPGSRAPERPARRGADRFPWWRGGDGMDRGGGRCHERTPSQAAIGAPRSSARMARMARTARAAWMATCAYTAQKKDRKRRI
jgi:hypothetical protein